MYYGVVMHWEVEIHVEVQSWLAALPAADQANIVAALRVLSENGPGLGRPLVDSIKGSAHPNMKELRVSHYRLLFAFDPVRNAIILVGGNKRNEWQSWYKQSIPLADHRYTEHLQKRFGEGN